MDGKMDELKQWKCENGHVLGVVERVRATSNGVKYYVSRLMLFRQAIDEESFVLKDVDVIANIEGTVMDIRCSCCSTVRTWWMGAASLERFLEKRKERQN